MTIYPLVYVTLDCPPNRPTDVSCVDTARLPERVTPGRRPRVRLRGVAQGNPNVAKRGARQSMLAAKHIKRVPHERRADNVMRRE
jgi:hypothetical protein